MTLEELKKQTLELQKKIAEGQEDMEIQPYPRTAGATRKNKAGRKVTE